MTQPVTIVGGGIAGLTLGILLRQKGAPVDLWEALDYPRHRVCGEFISGAGAKLLLDLIPELATRVIPAETVRFFAAGRSTPVVRLPRIALALSRWELDDSLARAFRKAGGTLLAKQRWKESFAQPGVVRATGRRLDLKGGWTGIKAHFQRFNLSADLEMHYSRQGYVGISRLPVGVNLCALVRPGFALTHFRADPKLVFAELFDAKSAARLQEAEIDPLSCCAVTGISFTARNPPDECCVGDALRMIAPFTGNGMSMAIESAFIAAEPLARFACGEALWPNTVRRIHQQCAKIFRLRFCSSALLRLVAARSWTQALMLSSLRTMPRLLPICFHVTR